MTSRNTIAIVGCGMMGCDVAAIFLAHGWRVEATCRNPLNWNERRARVRRSMGQLGSPFRDEDLQFRSDIVDIDWSGVTFGLESVPEVFELKRSVFAELDRIVPAHVPLATNTSSFRITEIAADCLTKGRMAGLHFFLPAHLVPAVEVVRGETTDPAVTEKLFAIMTAMGRVPIRVARDVPGFLANRIQHALMREAFAVIDEGLGTAEDVDAAVRFGFGFRYLAAGPILQKELAGLDTQLAAARSIYPSLHNGAEPSQVLQELVSQGRLGIKSGRGFWDWTPEKIEAAQDDYENKLIAATRLLNQTDTTSATRADDRALEGIVS